MVVIEIEIIITHHLGVVNMENRKKEFGDYFVGIDAGTNSAGWAVTDENYNIMKFHGKPMWGFRLFEEANPAAERRAFRTARRRQGRMVQRVKLLQEIFAAEISKKDPGFFMRMEESKYLPEDKTDGQTNTLFNDADYTDKDYHREYRTIYHLRKAFIDGKDIKDIRLLYLVVRHIIGNRGHFLFEGMKLSSVADFETSFNALNNYLFGEYEFDFSSADSEELKNCLKMRMGIGAKKKRLGEILHANDARAKAVCALLAGASGVKLADLFCDETLANGETSKITFSNSSFDDKRDDYENVLQDRILMIDYIKAVYDWSVLADILDGQHYISYAKVACYEQHKKDLRLLKDVMKRLCTKDEYNDMFKNPNSAGNYCAYSGMCMKGGRKVAIEKRCQRDDFYKSVKKALEKHDDDSAREIMKRIENRTFMPKQKNNENGVIPYQVNEEELKVILKNAEKNFPFLLENDADGITAEEKILKLLTFRIPYYVGPLNDAHRDSGNCWIVKRSNERVTPWNFERIVDSEASAEQFIRRMTNKCTYLIGEDVLPKDSLLYCEFMVSNELNNLRFNGEPIPAEEKKNIVEELFKTKKNVRLKDIADYYRRHTGEDIKRDNFSGVTEIHASMKAHIDFTRILGSRFDYESVEDAIRAIVLFGNDKKILKKRLEQIKNGYFTEEEIKKISALKYSDWGRFSEKFLCGIYSVNKDTGEYMNIIEALRSTDKNHMQLLSGEYDFKKEIDKLNAEINGEVKEFTYDALVKDIYASPAVKRSLWQVLCIVKEIEKIAGHPPKKIFMEMARGEDPREKMTKAPDSRRKRLVDLYKKSKDEVARGLLGSLEKHTDSDLRSKKLYLYYVQLGRCMYSGEEIQLEDLGNKNIYDIDHIYPQSKTKDDSLENMVLVKKSLNNKKQDRYPIPDELISEKARNNWKVLKSMGLISSEKYDRLTRRTPLSNDELAGFIARQLVETRQSTKAAAEILQKVYPKPETRFVYSRASNVDDFKKKFNIEKVREINDCHHARDAYLNIVVGNVFDVKFTQNPLNFIKSGTNYTLNNVMYDYDIARNGKTAWKSGVDGTIKTVKAVCSKENMLFTRHAYEATGGLFDQQIMKKGKGQLPTKLSDPHMKGQSFEEWIAKYGGYNKISGAYFFLAEHTVKNKRIRSIEFVPAYLAKDIERTHELLEEYAKNTLGLSEADIRIRKIKMDSLFSYNGFLMNVSGRTGDRLLFKPAIQLKIPPEDYSYSKKLVKFHNRRVAAREEIKAMEHDGLTERENLRLYDTFLDKLNNSPFSVPYKTPAELLSEKREEFIGLSLENQAELLYNEMHLFQCNRVNTDLSLLGGSPNSGIISTSKKLSPDDKWLMINKSVTGLFENSVNLLTV